MALPDLAAGHDHPEVGRRRPLAGVRPQRVKIIGEHVVGAQQTLDTHRRGDVGDLEQPAQIGDGQHQHAEHAVGAVDQREPFLLGQHDRLDAGRGEGVGGGQQDAVGIADHALAHQRQRAMGERSKITGAAEAAVLVHHRRDPGVDHGHVGLQGLLADAGAAGGQRRDAQQGQGADHLPLDLGPGAGGVRTDQAALQPAAQLDRDVPGGQGAEAGGDAVVRFMIIGERLDHRPGPAYLGQRLVGDHRPVRRAGPPRRPRPTTGVRDRPRPGAVPWLHSTTARTVRISAATDSLSQI